MAVVLAACGLLYEREVNQIAGRQEDLEVVRVNLLAQLLRSELRPAVTDVEILASGDGFRRYLENGRPADLQAAIQRAAFVSRAKPPYDQVRYLDENGQEIIRVNQGGQVVAPDKLQNKGNRGFFHEANTLPEGSLFISPFDLNYDGPHNSSGPAKPTLRFGVPIFDSSGRRRGIYVINYLGADLINGLQNSAAVLFKRVRLLNAQGYWLKGADPGQEWGFVVPDRASFTLARTDPPLWARMQSQAEGQSSSAGGLFTWRRVRPEEFAGVVAPDKLHADDAFLIVASAISPGEWYALFTGLNEITALAAAALTLLTLFCAWLFRGRLDAMRNLRVVNEQLELRVKARTDELAHSYDMLQKREQLLEETGAIAKIGGWEYDSAAGKGNTTLEIARIHELEPSQMGSNGLALELYQGDSQAILRAAITAAAERGVPYDMDVEIVTQGGTHKWVRTMCRPVVRDNKVTLLRGVVQDITERKQAEFRLQAQLQRLHMLEHITRAIGERQDLASILQVVICTLEVDLPLDFGCVCLYEPIQRMLTVVAVGARSLELAQRIGMTEQARIPIDANGLSRCIQGQLVYEPDIDALNFPFPRQVASGGLKSLVAAPLQIESQVFGVLLGARLNANSISSGECEFLRQLSEHVALAGHQAQLHTALQTAYEELRSTQQAVMQQERLRVLGQMASGIAHDINNAISPITLYSDSMLETEPGLSDRGRGYLHTIQQAASDVADTVARMREFYRQREGLGELKPLDVNTIVPQVIELTRARWEAMPQQRGVVIEQRVELASPLPLVSGAQSEIREALTNLVFNAVDAMPLGGLLTLRTRSTLAGRVCIEVSDTGVGMDEETRRRCLEPFFTTKGERGTGLGLAMVYGVMQRHGGEVEIESRPGAGTTVRLTFAEATTESPAKSATHLALPFGLNLLLVDDDPILLRTLRETLELDGHSTVTASGGQQGIDVFRSSIQPNGQTSVSAVITDLGMPYVDGRSVARAIKQSSPATPVILLTGWGERLLADGEKLPNIDAVLSKPPRLRELRKALAQLMLSTSRS